MEPSQIAFFEFDLKEGEVFAEDVDTTTSSSRDNKWRSVERRPSICWTIGSIFDGDLEGAARRWTETGDFTRFERIDGDFACIIFDRQTGEVALVNGPNGKYRIYYCRKGTSLYVSNHLWTLATRLDSLELSGFGLYNYFGLGHTLDPWTPFEDIRVVELGEGISVTSDRVERTQYHQLLDPSPERYSDLDEAATELSSVLEAIFEKRTNSDRESVIFLSGGIDSVTMLDFLTRVERGEPRAITFAMSGNSIPDEGAAHRAAECFGASHDVLKIDPSRGWDYWVDSLFTADTPHSVATIYRGAMETELYRSSGGVGDGEEYRTLFAGQDTRLHTPSYSRAKEIGLKRNVFDIPLTKLEKLSLNVLKYAKYWPYRGGGAAKKFVDNTRSRASSERFLLEAYAGHDPEVERAPDFQRLAEEMRLEKVGGMEELHRLLTMFMTRFQHTNNMNEMRSGFESRTNRVDLPFFDQAFIEASNRVPFAKAVEPKLTFKSGHAIPVSRKRVVRKMLDDRIPEDVLWRRSYAHFPYEDFFTKTFRESADRLLRTNRNAFYDLLDSDYHQFLAAYLEPTLDALPERKPPFPRELFYLLYLASVLTARDQNMDKRSFRGFLGGL